ncbi:hypothetical protein DFH06DRAFT_1196494 [Mycena polygramma]|nr:hypothetical protein DFH06DRAFT_1196494 [Mycena polygramma]
MDPVIKLHYRLYNGHAALPSKFALEPNHSNLAAIDVNDVAPPYTVENLARFILERENVPDKSAKPMVYIDRKDAKPASADTIIDITEGPSIQPGMAIRIVLPGGQQRTNGHQGGQNTANGSMDSAPWTLTAHYTVSQDKVNGWRQSGKYLHEHTKEPVQYLPFTSGERFTTDGVLHRLDTPGWKDVWKVINITTAQVGYVEAYQYDSYFTRSITVGGVEKPLPWKPLWTLTAHYGVSQDKVNGWHQSGKYLHERTKDPVYYLPFASGDKLTTDGVAHRLDTAGWKDVWKVVNMATGQVGHVEAYEYDSYFTRTITAGGVEKPMPW